MATPTRPVTASGFKNETASGRSPNPLPQKNPGAHVVNDSAPIRLLPVPPISTPPPNERMVSCSSLSKNSYFAESSRLPNPVCEDSLGGLRLMTLSPISRPKFGVMRLAMSTVTSVSRVPPSSGATMLDTVGSESSSLTNGSSVVSVAGKNLLPAKPCAHAAVGITNKAEAQMATHTAGARKSLYEKICFKLELLFLAGTCALRTCFPTVLAGKGLRSVYSHGAVQR